jgi:hypothetical protein
MKRASIIGDTWNRNISRGWHGERWLRTDVQQSVLSDDSVQNSQFRLSDARTISVSMTVVRDLTAESPDRGAGRGRLFTYHW